MISRHHQTRRPGRSNLSLKPDPVVVHLVFALSRERTIHSAAIVPATYRDIPPSIAFPSSRVCQKSGMPKITPSFSELDPMTVAWKAE